MPEPVEPETIADPIWRRPVAEAVGTFVMVFAGTGAIVINDVTGGAVTHVGISLTFGLVVMAMIYALGDISGAHMNPAVTLGFIAAGRFTLQRAPLYIASQFAGAISASAVLLAAFGNRASLGATLPLGSEGQSFILEVVLTAVLMFVVLCVSSGSKETGTMAGIAVGGVIGLEALFAGPICGASMNPIRSLAPALLSGNMRSLWVYLIAPILGALIAVPVWALIRPTPRIVSSME